MPITIGQCVEKFCLNMSRLGEVAWSGNCVGVLLRCVEGFLFFIFFLYDLIWVFQTEMVFVYYRKWFDFFFVWIIDNSDEFIVSCNFNGMNHAI